MRCNSWLAIALATFCTTGPAAWADTGDTPIGRKVDDFTLSDYRGKSCALADYQGKPVVLAFVGTECPLANTYALRLRDLAEEFEPQGVAFLGLDANLQDSLAEMATFARVHGIKFPMLKDNNNVMADKLGAVRTPEVFLLDREHVIRYWGRIDDQYGFKTGAGYVKPKLTERNLADAIAEVLAGKEVTRPVVKADGCFIGRVAKTTPQGNVTYANQIARIIQKRCLECHRPGEVAPLALTSYDEVLGWAETIREVVQQRRMPPWFADQRFGHFANDARLSDEEKQQICAWVDDGCPPGDPVDLPPSRKFAEGWLIGEPDQVIYMRSTPFTVPAEGLVEYQFYSVDPGWTTDKWIQAAELRPGNRAVVHHIRVDVAADSLSEGFTRDIGSYVPGSLPNVWPSGTAVYVPAHSKLSFELHYTPNGIEQDDRSMVGVRFADPTTIKKMVHSRVVDNITFRIPPGDPNYEVKSDYLFQKDAQLLFLWPHMHLRGKSFRFEAAYPDGTKETLLDVPDYDFNWQLRYIFAEPKLMPRGTRLHCTAHYDNSLENLSNPDPTRIVTASEQTWDEMMQGNFSAIYPEHDAACAALVALSRAVRPSAAESLDLAHEVQKLLDFGAQNDPVAMATGLALYRRLKSAYPSDRRIDYAWALALIKQREYRDAIPLLAKHLRLGGEIEAYQVMMWAQLSLDNFSDVREEAKALADRFPANARPQDEQKFRSAARFLGVVFAYMRLLGPDVLDAPDRAEQQQVMDRLGTAYLPDFEEGQQIVAKRVDQWRAAVSQSDQPAQHGEIRDLSKFVSFPFVQERERILRLFAP